MNTATQAALIEWTRILEQEKVNYALELARIEWETL